MLTRRRSQRTENRESRQSTVESRKVQSKKGTACRARTSHAALVGDRGHDGFLVGSGSVIQLESALAAGAVEDETSAEEARSAVTSSGAVGSVMPAWLSASMAGRVRSWRLLM